MTEPIMHIFPGNNFIDLTIYQFGHQNCPPFHTYGPAIRNHFLFHYVHSGKGQYRYENEQGQTITCTVEAGQGFLTWPNQINSYSADGSDPWSYSWAEFDGIKASGLIAEAGLTFAQPVYKGDGSALQQKMADALDYIAHNPAAPPFELIGHCYIFLSSLAESSLTRKKIGRSNLQDFYTNKVLSYIEAHYHETITVKDISVACNLDRSHISKIFSNVMGTNLRNFIISYRMSKACELMKNTMLSIGEISTMIGYPNMFNFSRAFKAVMGVSPRQWRNENK